MQKMRGFHIDMNVGHFSAAYLKRWLKVLALLGYDTIVWEVENMVRWETCPECVAPDAMSKDEFRDLLDECRRLNLLAVPLFQTLGHCEYVLKHAKYAHLAELPDRIDQYCPLHPELMAFLTRWIDEYLDLFGAVPYFHLGADEAWTLGECPHCRAFADSQSVSALYIRHVNRLRDHMARRNVRPAIWADMALHHPEALDELSRDVLLFDWMYDIHRGDGKVYVWGHGLQAPDAFSSETLERFGRYLFPHGQEPGRDPETFYTADYLAEHGFEVVTCPACSSARDNIFTPRMYYHLANVGDSFTKGRQAHLLGSLLTSWTVHLFPYELQRPALELPDYLAKHSGAELDQYEFDYCRTHFGVENREFFEAAGLLSSSCLFSDTPTSGHFKDCRGAPDGHIRRVLDRLIREECLAQELARSQCRISEYLRAANILEHLAGNAKGSHDELACWQLAARNLVHRAKTSAYVLKRELAGTQGLAAGNAAEAAQLLFEISVLKAQTECMYQNILMPSRRREVIEWIYGPLERYLADDARSAAGSPGRGRTVTVS